MIEQKQILELWKKSPRLPKLPEPLREIIGRSFQKQGPEKPGSPVLSYLQEKRDRLLPILLLPCYPVEKSNVTAREVLSKAGFPLLRNLLFVIWLQDLKSSGSFEKINYNFWHQQNLVAAFFAQHIGQKIPTLNENDLFLQAYLQHISLLFLSRTMPDIYNALEPGNFEHFLPPDREKKILGTDHGSLSCEVLSIWGFPQEFLNPVRHHHAERIGSGPASDQTISHQIVHLAHLAARLLLAADKNNSYQQFEKIFNQNLKQFSLDIQKILVEIVRFVNLVARPFQLPELEGLSIVRLLKDNPVFLKNRILPYEELVSEAIKSQDKVEALEKELQTLRSRATNREVRDSVTGLNNHTFLQEFLKQKISESSRYKYPVSVMIIDIDEFKLFNNSYGYEAGNQILAQLGEIIQENTRESDVVARFGDDEIAVVLPHSGRPQAQFVGQKLSRLIAGKKISDPNADRIHEITVSIGIATLVPTVSLMQSERLIRTARSALKLAQQNGGNCCILHDE